MYTCFASSTSCFIMQATVLAIGAYMAQQWRGPPWNAPIWPLIPLLLNRSIEVAALCLNNVFTSITVRCSDHTPSHPHTVSPHLGQRSSTSIPLVVGCAQRIM